MAPESKKRRDCEKCRRPLRVCLCPALPQHLLRLTGHVLVLQHPHELKKRLATVPLLRCCLDSESLTIATGRKLQAAGQPRTDSLLEGAQRGDYPLYVLFPGPDARDLVGLAEGEAHSAALRRASGRRQQQPASLAPEAAEGSARAREPGPDTDHQHELLRPGNGVDQAECTRGATPGRKEQQQVLEGGGATSLASAAAAGAEPVFAAAAVAAAVGELVATDTWASMADARKDDAPARGAGPAGVLVPHAVDASAAGGREASAAGRLKADASETSQDSRPASAAPNGSAMRAHGGAGGKASATLGAASGAGLPPPAYLLLVIDGTWRQAREMFNTLQPRCLPPQGRGIQVALKPEDVLPESVLLAQHAAAKSPAAEAAVQDGPAQDATVLAPLEPFLGSLVGALGPDPLAHAARGTDTRQSPQAGSSCGGVPGGLRDRDAAAVDACPGQGGAATSPDPERPPTSAQSDCSVRDAIEGRGDPEGGGWSPLPEAGPGSSEKAEAKAAGAVGTVYVTGAEDLPVEYDPEMPCLIRKEPVPGFVTTYEATARALGILERDQDVATQLLRPLRLMTRLQASFSPAVMSRMRAEPEPARLSKVK